jgi:hypothetical protein
MKRCLARIIHPERVENGAALLQQLAAKNARNAVCKSAGTR